MIMTIRQSISLSHTVATSGLFCLKIGKAIGFVRNFAPGGKWNKLFSGGGTDALLERQCRAMVATAVLIVASVVIPATCLKAGDSSRLRSEFASPSRDYSTGPLWVWNDLLTEQQIVDTLSDLAGQKVKQVWVHPRPGLMTPYLSDAWFRLWKVALREADRLDMNIWIYERNVVR